MDNYQGHHGYSADRADVYGNPPVTGAGQYGAATAMGTGAHGHCGGQFQPSREEHKTGGILHRSGSSSSSSSSEDDGMGGRRKKGIKEKIKEKLPGGHKDSHQQQQETMGTGGAYGQQGHAGMTGAGTGVHGADGEKKGFMDKIKEKLPGQH